MLEDPLARARTGKHPRSIIASLILISPLFNPITAHAKSLSLKEAIQYAIERSPDLDSFGRQQAISELQYESAFAKFLPSLDLSSTSGLNGQAPAVLATPWAAQANLGLTENLYDNGQSLTQYHIASLNRDFSRLGLEK